ncbi:MAG: RHS repeat-associated core domain-containing protein [bacterium]
MKNKFKIKIVSHCVGLLPLSFVVFAMLANLGVTSVYASETLTFVHQDHLSSTTLATNEQGEVVSRQVYYPYGSTRNTQGVLPTERAYTSQVSDTDTTGLYYYNARYYNPATALFTQADSVVVEQNKYNYAYSNPVFYLDPSGNKNLSYTDWVAENYDKIQWPSAYGWSYDCADVPIWLWAMYAKYAGIDLTYSAAGKTRTVSDYEESQGDFKYEYFASRAMLLFGGDHLAELATNMGFGGVKLEGDVSDIALQPGDVISAVWHNMLVAGKATSEYMEILVRPDLLQIERDVLLLQQDTAQLVKTMRNPVQSLGGLVDKYVSVSRIGGYTRGDAASIAGGIDRIKTASAAQGSPIGYLVINSPGYDYMDATPQPFRRDQYNMWVLPSGKTWRSDRTGQNYYGVSVIRPFASD